MRRKYEKQGWSQPKIERALAGHVPKGFPGNLHPGLRRWLAESVLAAGEAFLLVHWDSTKLEVTDAIRMPVSAFLDPNNRILEEQLYDIEAVVTHVMDKE